MSAPPPPTGDPIHDVMAAAAHGVFPPADGGATVVGPDRSTGLHGVIAYTGHAVIATDRCGAEELRAMDADGFGGACHPDVLRRLAGPNGFIDVLDAALVAFGTGAGAQSVVETDQFDDHHRVRYARRLRRDVRVMANSHGLLTLGRGLGGHHELGIETFDPGLGTGAQLLADALAETPKDEPLFAACAPGNARSLRSLLSMGFQPIGSVVIIKPA